MNCILKNRSVFLDGGIFVSLFIVLMSCTPTPSIMQTPTTRPSVTPPALASPANSPTPTFVSPAPLGLAPLDCQQSMVVLKRIDSPASLIGMPPAWVGGFTGSSSYPLLLFGDNHTMYTWIQYTQHGWEHKFLYTVGPAFTQKVTFHGANLRIGTPLWLSADNVPEETTTLVLDPQDPTIVNRPGDWVEFPGGLDIPTAGCYYLQANWNGGSWKVIFAAGV